MKSRDARKFSKEETVEFERKFKEVKAHEKIDRAVGFIFSRGGFTEEAEEFMQVLLFNANTSVNHFS